MAIVPKLGVSWSQGTQSWLLLKVILKFSWWGNFCNGTKAIVCIGPSRYTLAYEIPMIQHRQQVRRIVHQYYRMDLM